MFKKNRKWLKLASTTNYICQLCLHSMNNLHVFFQPLSSKKNNALIHKTREFCLYSPMHSIVYKQIGNIKTKTTTTTRQSDSNIDSRMYIVQRCCETAWRRKYIESWCVSVWRRYSTQLILVDEVRNTVSHTESVEQLTVHFYFILFGAHVLWIFFWLVFNVKFHHSILTNVKREYCS